MLKQLVALFALACAVVSQASAEDKPAPAAAPKPAAPARKPAAAPSRVDTVIELLKGGMTEGLVIKTLQRENKPVNLTTAEMLKLQKAGVSETVINAMIDPSPVVAAAPAPAPAPIAAPPADPVDVATTMPVSLPNVRKAPKKRKLAVMPFKYSAVATWVNYWFHRDMDIGQGIRAMMTARMAQAKSVTLVERDDLAAIEKELNRGNTAGVNQGTKVKIGKLSSADCILLGDITIFGRDDKAERSRKSGYDYIRRIPGMPARVQNVQMGQFSKEEKAVVAIALRIVDTETGEVLETAEARGESSRSSKNWDVFVSGNGAARAESNEMTASGFQETIIGEATSNAVDKVIQFLDARVPELPIRGRKVEGRVAKVSGSTIILGIGTSEGVENGDRFEILQIVSEVKDPVTHEVLDVETVKVGEMVVTNARDKIATGPYSGKTLPEGQYTARLMQ